MAVVRRETKTHGAVYWVCTSHGGGRKNWERVGTDRRAAERLDQQRRREVRAGSFAPDAPTGRVSVEGYAARWLDSRRTRTASDERRHVQQCLALRWLAKMPISEFQPRHAEKLVRELQAGDLAPKTIANIWGTFRTMGREARLEGVISDDPFVLRRGVLSRTPVTERDPYSGPEIVALTTHPDVPAPQRVLYALQAYGGLRLGEACGRRWRDLDPGAEPLWCLLVATQYDDRPLKTDRPRRVPVHPELRRILEAWWSDGWELYACRRPTLDDFIVPNVSKRAQAPHHTKTSAYRGFRRACLSAGVDARTVHALRHTMITAARRGGARVDVLERVTHNASGGIVDRYTHWEWEPLCEAVTCVSYAVDPSVDRRVRTMNDLSSLDGGGAGNRTRAQGEIQRENRASVALGGAADHRGFAAAVRSVDANQRRLVALRLLAEVDPGAAAPGLTVCRGLELVLAGNVADAVDELRRTCR